MSQTEKTWASRKLGAETSATRTALLDAANRLILEEGCGAVTSRRVAAEAGLKPQLVHYYFRSMDDLFLEVLRRSSEAGEKELAAALESDEPLRALWEHMAGTPATYTSEFAALASHNEIIRDEMCRIAEKFRAMQSEAIRRHLELRGIKPKMPPVVATVLLVALSQVLLREKALGMSLGHKEAEALVEECLRQFEETGDGPFH